MIPIDRSPVAFCFDDVPPEHSREVHWLEPEETAVIWRDWGNPSAKHLYDLPVTHWMSKVTWRPIGRWLEACNEVERREMIVPLISRISGWSDAQDVVVIQSAARMLTLSMKCFDACLQGILCAFDDGPLLIPRNLKCGPVFRFVPLGDIQFTQRAS